MAPRWSRRCFSKSLACSVARPASPSRAAASSASESMRSGSTYGLERWTRSEVIEVAEDVDSDCLDVGDQSRCLGFGPGLVASRGSTSPVSCERRGARECRDRAPFTDFLYSRFGSVSIGSRVLRRRMISADSAPSDSWLTSAGTAASGSRSQALAEAAPQLVGVPAGGGHRHDPNVFDPQCLDEALQRWGRSPVVARSAATLPLHAHPLRCRSGRVGVLAQGPRRALPNRCLPLGRNQARNIANGEYDLHPAAT